MTKDRPELAGCPRCGASGKSRCVTASGRPTSKPHRLRVAVTAHQDPALDEWFPRRGPCFLCGPVLDARHRAVDGIAGMLAAGEDPDVVAEEHGVSQEAVGAVAGWMVKWPGAWR